MQLKLQKIKELDVKGRVSVKRLLGSAMFNAIEEGVESRLEELSDDQKVRLYIAAENSKVFGAIFLEIYNGNNGLIIYISTDEKYRGQGVGRSMLNELARIENLRSLEAETDADSVNFYLKTGFEVNNLGQKYPGVERFHCKRTFDTVFKYT